MLQSEGNEPIYFILYHFENVKIPSEITFLSNALPKPETALDFGRFPGFSRFSGR
jgi:hypothetical protein